MDVESNAGSRSLALNPTGAEGYFEIFDSCGQAGDRYTYRLDDGPSLPDLASRFQPQGILGPSLVINSHYPWTSLDWKRPSWKGQIVYELHIGTFSADGTFLGAIAHLDYLRDLGITCIEVMPVTERSGERNWGYDGVFPFAPAHSYGCPNDFRAFIDAAHQMGLAVMLDVVFNHLGPQGNVAPAFSKAYFHSDSETPWGSNFNLDGETSEPVRC